MTLQEMRIVDELEAFLLEEITTEVSGVDDLTAALVHRFGSSLAGVLFYGSCLRTGEYEDKMLDFYVLVDRYGAAYGPGLRAKALALANRILPPNVFYLETSSVDGEGGVVTLRAKYAVLTLDHFAHLCSDRTFNSSVWVRFAQPSRLIYARDDAVRTRVTGALASAVRTAVQSVVGVIGTPVTSARIWQELFRESYRVELRAEGGTRPLDIFKAAQVRYEGVTPLALAAIGYEAAEPGHEFHPAPGVRPPSGRWQRAMWLLRCWQGKTLSVLRLIKAAFTFDGGIDYLAWKIQRHSGVKIEITPWQRRHPVLAGLVLFWRLRLKGAFR